MSAQRVVTPTCEPLVEDNVNADLVTVVIPAFNEAGHIARCVRSVQQQDYAKLQIIVVDGGSADGTAGVVRDLASRDGRITLLTNPERTIPKSLNLAVRHARGAWLVRVDAHATVPPDYVSRACGHLASGRWGGVGGRKDGVGTTAAGRAIAVAMAAPFGVGNSTYHYGTRPQAVEHIPFGAYPVALVRRLGGWDERLRVNQDFEFDYRVRTSGQQLLFDPALVIHWDCRQTLRDLSKQYYRYGCGKANVALLHPGSLRPRHLAAPALVCSFAVALAMAPFYPLAAASLPSAYVIAALAAAVPAGRSLTDTRSRLLVAPAFAVMHVGWGLGFVREAVTRPMRGFVARTPWPVEGRVRA